MTEEYSRLIFSKNFKNLMLLNKKTQKDIMNDLNLPSATVSSWVNGVRLPRMDKIRMLADYFNVSVPHLLADNWDYKELNNVESELYEILDNETFSIQELEEILQFMEFLKSKRKPNQK